MDVPGRSREAEDGLRLTQALPAEGLRLGRFSPLRLLLSLLVSGAVVYGLLRFAQVPPGQIWSTLKNTSPAAVLCGLLLHFATYCLRCLRFRLLVHSRSVPVKRLLDIVLVHNFMNHFLPLRAGELTYVYLLRRREGVPVAEGLTTLVISRCLDLVSFTLYYPLAILALHLGGFAFPPFVRRALWAAALLFLLLMALLVALSWKGRALLDRFERTSWVRGLRRRSRLAKLVLDKLEEVSLGFEHLGNRRIYWKALALSLATLGLVYLVGYVLLTGMGYFISFPLIIVCSTLASLGFMLPLYSFGGFGTLEAGWTVGCMMAGFSKEMALASGFSFHILVLAYVTLMGIVGMVRIGASGGRGPEEPLFCQERAPGRKEP
ncbi:MAG: lysylphosphatidylglycerol synthase transmembrane domain-containing protein [bacterium]